MRAIKKIILRVVFAVAMAVVVIMGGRIAMDSLIADLSHHAAMSPHTAASAQSH